MNVVRTTMATLAVLAAATAASAQSGGLTVKVVDASDQSPLPGATVVLTNAIQLVAETVVQTDVDGVVEFPILRPGGGYIVQVTMPGYATVRKDEIRVKISENQTLVLPLGAEITETETITAKVDTVDLEKNQTVTTFGDEFIQDLPVQGRFYTNILTLAPGVSDEDMDGNPNVNGARERDFAAIVGGVSNVDPLTGLALTNINYDSIEEVEVITAGAGVEFGRAQGGFANIIEKQGSNQFEGVFNFLFRTSALDGNGASNVPENDIQDFEWIQPAIQISGPIMRDKLWYRLSHDWRKIEVPIQVGSGVEVQTQEQTTSSDMITWQASRRNKLAFSYLSDPQTTDNIGVNSTNPTETTYTVHTEGPLYRLSWTAPFSPRLLVDSLMAYQDASLEISPTTNGIANTCVVGLPFLENAQCVDLVTGQTSGSYNINWDDQRQRFTVRTQASIFGGRFWGSSHQFTVGFDAENERYERTLDQRPELTFFETSNRNSGEVERVGLVSARLTVPSVSTAEATGTNWAVFFEDQLKPLPNLTITVAARYDNEEINSNGMLPFDPEAESIAYLNQIRNNPANPNAVLQNAFTAYEDIGEFINNLAVELGISRNEVLTGLNSSVTRSTTWDRRRRPENVDIRNQNVSPYLAVSWDPFKTAKTRFAFSAGRHYDKIFLAIPLIELEPVTTDLNFRAERVGGNWVVNGLCGTSGACLRPTANVSTVDRNLTTPYQDEFTFTVEREIAAETVLAFRYLNRKFEDQYQDIDLNHIAGDYGRCQLQISANTPPLTNSPGLPTGLEDPFTGEIYNDTDPGNGDGRVDDCVGRFVDNPSGSGGEPVGGLPIFDGFLVRPDGFPDAYVQNPGWGEIFVLGNFNTTQYEAYTLELTRRQYRNWQLSGSYTWAEAVGDAEDFQQLLGDDRTIIGDEYGYLSYDQRHALKVNATTLVPWAGGFRFGTALGWFSGYPYSIRRRDLSYDSVPPEYVGISSAEARARLRYVTGQRNDQRNESWWNIDLQMTKEFNLQGGVNMQLSVDVFNILNDDPLRIFAQDNGFNAYVREFGREWQLGLRVAF